MPPGHRMEEGWNQTLGRGATDCIYAAATSIMPCAALPSQQSLKHHRWRRSTHSAWTFLFLKRSVQVFQGTKECVREREASCGFLGWSLIIYNPAYSRICNSYVGPRPITVQKNREIINTLSKLQKYPVCFFVPLQYLCKNSLHFMNLCSIPKNYTVNPDFDSTQWDWLVSKRLKCV